MARRRQSLKDFSNIEDMRAALYCRVSYIGKRDENGDEDRRAADEKSVDDQEAEGTTWAERARVRLVRIFRDAGLSASPFAAKGRGREARPEFDQMLKLVEAGEVDVVWVWAIDRSNRDLGVFVELRDLFLAHQVALVVSGRLHDPNNYDDWMLLGFTSQFGERFSFELSRNVRRGQASSAKDGKPHGLPYGYKRTRAQNRPENIPADRVWVDKKTKLFVWQEPDLCDDDDQAVDRSPAWVVREIYRLLADGDSLGKIATDLNTRGIRLPGGAKPGPRSAWTNTRIKRIALNPAYLGLLVYQHDWAGKGWAEAHKSAMPGQGKWPPLVGEEQFWQVHRLLTSRAWKTDRPYAAKSLLSCIVTCAKCGGDVVAGWTQQKNGTRYNVYACGYRRCASISRPRLDDYVEEVITGFLSDPDVYAVLTKVDKSAAAMTARADADQARGELEQMFADQEAGLVSARAATIEERRLTEVITEAEQRIRAADRDPVLTSHAGPGAEAAWGRASREVKRQIIRRVADIRLRPAGMSGGQARWRGGPISGRVEWHPLLGGGEVIPALPPAPGPGQHLLASETRSLSALAQDGPLLLTELDQRLAMARGSIERVIKRMRERGWVTSELAARNGARGRRTSAITITEAGRQALNDR